MEIVMSEPTIIETLVEFVSFMKCREANVVVGAD
jgi:hypothetical protein